MESTMNIRARIDRVSQEARAAIAARDEPARGNSRRGDRHRLVEEKARVTHEGQQHEAELINVSGGGAMIAASFDADLWDKVDLHLGEDGTIECAVRWVSGGRMGLEFAHETQLDCSAEQQAVLLRGVINKTYGAARSGQTSATPEKAEDDNDAKAQRAKRHPLIWSGVLHVNASQVPARVRNISATGAMVQCSSNVRVGAEAVLELSETLTVSATVGWAVGDQVGLRFHTPFDVTQLSRSTPEVAPQRWERPSYLNKSAETASPWDPRWQRISMREIGQELDGFLKR
jgi:hypothetical protein